MKVAIYARVSTDEERQDLNTQLLPVRDYCKLYGHEVYKEYCDVAKSLDLLRRTAWRGMLDDALRHHFKAIVIFKFDRAFRSVKHMHDTLSVLEAAGVEFVSTRERFDTTTAMGRLMLNLIASFAEFELDVDRERINTGLDRARRLGTRSGRAIGRPKITFTPEQLATLAKVVSGEISVNAAAKESGLSRRTVGRWMGRNKGELK